EAPTVATAADGSLRPDLHVPELAGHPVRAAVDAAVQHQAGPDPRADADVDDVVEAAARALAPLAERPEVRVVVDLHVEAEPLGELRAGADARPAGQDRGHDGTGLPVDRAGESHADADDVAAPKPSVGEHGVDELDGGVEGRGSGVVDVELGRSLGEH